MLCTNKREIKCKAGGAANPGRPASLGQLSDWLLLPWEAVLGDEGVSQNQSPRSSDFHSLRMCWVDTVSLRFTPCVHTYSTYFLWSCWRTSSAFGARKHRWLFFLLFGSFCLCLHSLPELCSTPLHACTSLLSGMDLVWIVGFVVSVCSWFSSAERHSVYWNSTNTKWVFGFFSFFLKKKIPIRF